MHAERDHLVSTVFPELHERLDRLGLDFYDVDLRWGVPETGWEGERANPWRYCKRWIELVEPFFICILGQRYGRMLAPEELEEPGEEQAYNGLSITEMEVRHAVLGGGLHRRSFFYLRSTPVPTTAPQEIYAEYVDRAAHGRIYALRRMMEASGRPIRQYECRWTGSGFSALDGFGRLVLEDLWSGVLRDERYVAKEAWRRVLGHDPDDDPLYTDESQPIPEVLWTRLVEAARPRPADPLAVEAIEMVRYANGRLRRFTGRVAEVRMLSQFVHDNLSPEESRLCVVQGPAGRGKSALLAKLADDLAGTRHHVVTHFVGATERSADVRAMLARLTGELDRAGIPNPEPSEPAAGVEALSSSLAARLKNYENENRVVLLIDAVDQLASGQDLAWLPYRLSHDVRIVLTNVDPESAQDRAQMLRSGLHARRPKPRLITLPGLDERDVRGIVVGYLEEYCKELEPAEVDEICRMEQARNPLYLLVMLNELRALGGNDMQRVVRSLITELPRVRPDVASLFEWRLESLERAFGVEAVRLWSSYLCLGRVGMSSMELRELVVSTGAKQDGSVVPLIERGMRQYLQRRGPQLDLFHSQLRQAIMKRYLYLGEAHQRTHAAIADYFRRKADPKGDGMWSGGHERALSELPYHLAEGGRLIELLEVLTDFRFVERKATEVAVSEQSVGGGKVSTMHMGVFALQDDLDLAIAKLDNVTAAPSGRLFVTAFDAGGELAIRCPRCGATRPCTKRELGTELLCANCAGRLKVNPFPNKSRGGFSAPD